MKRFYALSLLLLMVFAVDAGSLRGGEVETSIVVTEDKSWMANKTTKPGPPNGTSVEVPPMKKDKNETESSDDMGNGSNKTNIMGAPMKKDKNETESSNGIGGGSNKTNVTGAPMKKDRNETESSNGNDKLGKDSGSASPCDAVICETASRKCVVTPQGTPMCVAIGSRPMPKKIIKPLWWDRVYQNFDGENLQLCARRGDVAPSSGEKCSKRTKVCFFGTKACKKVGSHPEKRCECVDGKWACGPCDCPSALSDKVD